LIGKVGMRAIKLEASRDGSRLFGEAFRGMHHFAGNGMDSARGEAVLLLALAATEEYAKHKKQSDG
jgi:hypothetical protein